MERNSCYGCVYGVVFQTLGGRGGLLPPLSFRGTWGKLRCFHLVLIFLVLGTMAYLLDCSAFMGDVRNFFIVLFGTFGGVGFE